MTKGIPPAPGCKLHSATNTVPSLSTVAEGSPNEKSVHSECSRDESDCVGLAADHTRSLPGDILVDFAERNNLLMLDLLPPLLAAAAEGGPLYNRREQHWTARGNHVVARALVEFLEREDVADPNGH